MATSKVTVRMIADDTKVRAALKNMAKKYASTPRVYVGYAAHYAIYVHEMPVDSYSQDSRALAANPKRNIYARPKFLSHPLRVNRNFYKDTIIKVIKAFGGSLEGLTEGMLAAARDLLRDSKEIVPVDTGCLRSSGYIELEDNGGIKLIEGNKNECRH